MLAPTLSPARWPAALDAIAIADLAAAAPAAALLLDEMPLRAHFRRDHFPAPRLPAETWVLEVGGAVRRPLRLDLQALQALGALGERVTLECAGHRRAELRPLPDGLPWSVGAVSEARWRGTPLAAVLARAQPVPGARAVVLEGADSGAFPGVTGTERFARALPLAKALAADTLLAWEAAGEPIAADRGGPVRAVVPGWYATDSVKWLARATVVDGDFDGAFEARDYRLRAHGQPSPGRRLTAMPVPALLLDPSGELALRAGLIRLRGIAWGGERGIARVDVRLDGGRWVPARLAPWRGPYARRFWSAGWRARPGRHVVDVCAIDGAGHRQPQRPVPNIGGYANNSVQRTAFIIL
jgi:sulfane dehydrogenase subunit SoxC